MAPIENHTRSLNEEERAKVASIMVAFPTHSVHAQQQDTLTKNLHVKAEVNELTASSSGTLSS